MAHVFGAKPSGSTSQKNHAQCPKEKAGPGETLCPFLLSDQTCEIYAFRPFSCRQLYSLKKCGVQGPTVHRQAMVLAQQFVKEIQQLDHTGYSGHISYILQLLEMKDFKKVYYSGDFNPQAIRSYGKKHCLVINRMVSPK
jgi:hypothetical protein